MRKLASFAAVFALLLGTTTTVLGQQRQGVGLMLGLGGTYTPSFDFTATIPEFPDEALQVDLDGGIGVAVRAGFGITPVFVIFGGFEQSWHDLADAGDDVQLRHILGGVRVNLPMETRANPFVSLGYGERRLRGEDEEDGSTITITGNFFDIGAGVLFYLAPTLGLDIGANYGFGEFDDARSGPIRFNIDTGNVNVIRLRVGLTWMPMARR